MLSRLPGEHDVRVEGIGDFQACSCPKRRAQELGANQCDFLVTTAVSGTREVLTLDIREGVMSRRGESCRLPRVFFFRFETGAEHGATASSKGRLGAGRSMLALQVVVINRS